MKTNLRYRIQLSANAVPGTGGKYGEIVEIVVLQCAFKVNRVKSHSDSSDLGVSKRVTRRDAAHCMVLGALFRWEGGKSCHDKVIVAWMGG